MKLIVSLSIALGTLVNALHAQAPTKYWIKFKDKNGTPYTISNPGAFLTQRSVDRRTTYGIAVNQSDLPVNPAYINAVKAVPNATVLYASKWMNGVVVSTTNSVALSAISSLSFVSSSAPVNRYRLDLPPVVKEHELPNEQKAAASSNTSIPYAGRSYWQHKTLGIDCLHQNGKRGQGMMIAVLDAGFSNVDVNPVFDSLRNRGGILGTRDFVSGGNSVYEDDPHGAAVLSLLAAIKPNVILGSAPMADYWLLRTEDNASPSPYNESISEEYNWIRGAEFADSVGADVLTTSLGYTTFEKSQYNHTFADLNGRTAPMSIAATMAARKGMFVANAAGNGGGSSWPYIGVPADADSICTVGAIDSLGQPAYFTSKGPTADGRIKPDLVAIGVAAWVSYQASGYCESGNGTSYATPILAGGVACFWQAHKQLSNMKILDTLKKFSSHRLWPDFKYGWGTPAFCAIPVGVSEKGEQAFPEVKIMPNPFQDRVLISIPNTQISKYEIQIFNLLGELCYTGSLNGNETKSTTINTETLVSGTYLIRISDGNSSYTSRIIKN